jgi:hypothetical protein
VKLLVKEIRSKAGNLHFRRWRLLYTPWFAVYIHGIYRSDEDLHPHSHPWNFLSLILRGGYWEDVWSSDGKMISPLPGHLRMPGFFVGHTRRTYHTVILRKDPAYTLVFTFGRKRPWGYLVDNGFVEESEYRRLKNEAKQGEIH